MGFRSIKGLLFLIFILVVLAQAANASPCRARSHRKEINCDEGFARRASVFSAGNYALEAAGGSAWFLTCVVLFRCFRPKKENPVRGATPSVTRHSAVSSPSPRGVSSESLRGTTPAGSAFTLEELAKITNNFSNSHKIRPSTKTSTYKGKLQDGTIVVVKRARRDSMETRQGAAFENELSMLSNVEHLNLVKLLTCLETDEERMFVIEYVPNGTLREHLDGVYGAFLEFPTRLDIAIDVAHALTYLHLYADQPIIHRDVKASNVLLTDTFRAKVANFGFSRAGPSEVAATHVTTEVKGTAGYLDPEYLQTYQLTPKSDVFSFGVLLLEIFSGRRPIELYRSSEERITVRWAFDLYKNGRIQEMLDPNLPKNPMLVGILERVAEVAFKCVAPTRQNRPTMKEAAELLWNIRKDYQALATTPRASDRHTPLSSPFHPRAQASETYRSPWA